MKGLYRYLSPLAPDISGAVAVLYELGGIIVICDAGGCTGNTCGFDEPRWFTKNSAIYSAGLRDLDAILGRDDRLLDKIEGAVQTTPAHFIALVGTPVPAVIATDYAAICKMCEERFGLPSIYIDTTGMKNYDVGQKKAYEAVFNHIQLKDDKGFDYGIWGATPMDLPALDSVRRLQNRLDGSSICFGMEGDIDAFRYLASVKENIVVSPSGLSLARTIEKKYGIPYRCTFVLPKGTFDGNVLIIHQQVLANSIRESIGHGDVGSFFLMDKELMQPNDIHFEGETEWIQHVKKGNYDCIFADPLYKRALPFYQGIWIPLPHFAVSGQMYAVDKEDGFWKECGLW